MHQLVAINDKQGWSQKIKLGGVRFQLYYYFSKNHINYQGRAGKTIFLQGPQPLLVTPCLHP